MKLKGKILFSALRGSLPKRATSRCWDSQEPYVRVAPRNTRIALA